MEIITRSTSELAIQGGQRTINGPLPVFSAIGEEEARAAYDAVKKGPLSGYLGGQLHGGYHVERLEAKWAEMFGVKYAVACNSATSGLLIACMAVGIKDHTVRTTPYTMSGTVAPAALLGADIIFGDIDAESYCLQPAPHPIRDITITTNLFGHPSELHPNCFVIEDAAQSILATRDGKRCSATITIFSGNVHKQIQCGEGGMCCTDNDGLANQMRLARNHRELVGHPFPGLNLRLTEVSAAIWYEQLKKAELIVMDRKHIAETLSKHATGLGIPPIVKPGCTHSYYVWALKRHKNAAWIAKALLAEGFPCKLGYTTPLFKLAAFKQPIRRKVVEETEQNLIIYENTAYDPTPKQLQEMCDALEKVTEHL